MYNVICYYEDIIKDTKLYTQFTVTKYPYPILYNGRTFQGAKIICRSTVTGRFLSHSIIKVAIHYSLTYKFRFEIQY